MPNINKQEEVNGLIPSETVAESLKGKDAALALYNSLSIKAKPENETPEQRQSRIMRSSLIASTFGLSVKELETFLEDYVKSQNTPNSSHQNETKKVQDSRNTLEAQNKAINARKIGAISSAVGAGVAVAGLINPIFATIGVVITVISAGDTILRTINGKSNLLGDRNEKYAAYIEKLKPMMEKISQLNDVISKKMDEIVDNKNKLKPKAFSEYKKTVIKELRSEMEKLGVIIKVEEIKEEQKQEEPKPESENQQTELGAE